MAARETQTENTKVMHCTRGTHDVYIGRPSKWGNPFVIGKDGTREQVIQKYWNWLMTQPSLLAALPELKGRTLGCWCSPAACHGDVLAELALEGEMILTTRERRELQRQAGTRNGRADRLAAQSNPTAPHFNEQDAVLGYLRIAVGKQPRIRLFGLNGFLQSTTSMEFSR